jgi:hypothetical protein
VLHIDIDGDCRISGFIGGQEVPRARWAGRNPNRILIRWEYRGGDGFTVSLGEGLVARAIAAIDAHEVALKRHLAVAPGLAIAGATRTGPATFEADEDGSGVVDLRLYVPHRSATRPQLGAQPDGREVIAMAAASGSYPNGAPWTDHMWLEAVPASWPWDGRRIRRVARG